MLPGCGSRSDGWIPQFPSLHTAPTKRPDSTWPRRTTSSCRRAQIALVRTGLVIEVPTGHFLAIFARSSTPLKRGLMVANGVGVIDPDYSGPNDEVMIQVLNFTDADVQVSRGDRLAQGIVLPAPRVDAGRKSSEIREVHAGVASERPGN